MIKKFLKHFKISFCERYKNLTKEEKKKWKTTAINDIGASQNSRNKS